MSKELFSTNKRLDNCFSREVLPKEGKCYVPYKEYCPTKQNGKKGECSTNYEKIRAGFTWLLNMFEDHYDYNNSENDIVKYAEYAILWLSNIVNKMPGEGITTLKGFYAKYIKNNTHYTNFNSDGKDFSNSLKEGTGCAHFKKFIEENENFMNMNMNTVVMLYEAFETICNMYTGFDEKTIYCKKYLNYAKIFIDIYGYLNQISDITEDSPYRQVLSTLLNDYNNFKKKHYEVQCSKSLSLPTIEKIQASALSSKFTLSNLSIEKKLSIVLSIFGVIVFFLGISYKYSLFGFRKGAQTFKKKAKKIKKKMDN
ncbi:hypothetical protein YYC_02093 [Plasmodium yoelii 17X]|uniref:PIR protein n=3 Tax=Plasmodium yoelii TaxID=5861 RepID=A0AAE9WRZ3_PLAYO|nr:PIR protein [Plasmodium yoelii]ETB61167.1 hypothetical protein YYC_02093 [Plasmodium yoelii 17X]WBY58927.1 PIR protein [Plasmodium yoelii yoelii]CDS44949.1 YIR protein [Plasmodium yoelii]VTZ79760.1 PIR protein [Plasmodium yoelii]|eukprot:XP_022812517.1 PIR protein [Plasmodium yoelii]